MADQQTLTFYITREKSDDTSKDFPNLIYDLRNTYIFVDVIENSPTTVSFSGSASYKSEMEYLSSDRPVDFKDMAFCARLTIAREDYHTFSKLRRFLTNRRDYFRIYSDQQHAFLPQDDRLVSLEFGSVNIKTFDALKKFSLVPIYYSDENGVYYAINLEDKKIHLVNPYLLEYIWDKNIPESKLPELSYPVSDNLNLFSAMYDKDLIPKNFYEYYGKSAKVINRSNFDINNPGRKVFVKPLIFEFKPENGSFYTYTGPDGGSLIAMDKIRPGESLEQTILRVLKDDLKISNDYIAAHVSSKIEFDRDRDGILTPRLIIFVYVDQINDPSWALQMSQTGWKSSNGATPKVNKNPDFEN